MVHYYGQLWSGESTRNQRNLVACATGHIQRGVWVRAGAGDWQGPPGPDWGDCRATRAGSAPLTPHLFVTSFRMPEGRKKCAR